MTNLATFRVHIAPLGFEVDRITIPLKQTKADKLWLLAHDNRTLDEILLPIPKEYWEKLEAKRIERERLEEITKRERLEQEERIERERLEEIKNKTTVYRYCSKCKISYTEGKKCPNCGN